MPPFVVPRRGDPDTWYPAGVSGTAARWLTLPRGERVRVVENVRATNTTCTALLLHGWGCNAFHFRRLLPALEQRGIHAIAVDLLGHGLSEKPPDAAAYSAVSLARFVRNVLDALRVERAGLIGHSLGAAIALDAAVESPNRVAWLQLLNPVGLSRLTVAPLLIRFPVGLAERIPAALSHAVGATALYLAYGRITRAERGDLEQYLYPTLVAGGRFGMLAYARAFSWEPRGPDTLRRLTCPTRVMLGEHDRVVRQRAARQLLAAFPEIHVDVVAGAGHVLAEEASEQVADAAAELARGVSPPNAGRPAQAATL